jgi:hypothetical protein
LTIIKTLTSFSKDREYYFAMIVDLKRDCIIVDDDKGKPDPSSFRMV